jgi:hypothetical protein
VLKLWNALVSSQMLTQDHYLKPTQGYCLNHSNLTKRWLGEPQRIWFVKKGLEAQQCHQKQHLSTEEVMGV